MNVSAIIVTRGDQDLDPIVGQRWPEAVQEIVIWDNSALERRDVQVYGRYAAIEETHHPLVYVQDDDCTVEGEAIEELFDVWAINYLATDGQSGIVANMPQSRWNDYPDSCLLGWGAVFHRDSPKRAFNELAKYLYEQHEDAEGDPWLNPAFVRHFHRTCDVLFTTLTPHAKVDVGFAHLPWAEGPDRMFKQAEHKPERDRMLELARTIRDAERSLT